MNNKEYRKYPLIAKELDLVNDCINQTIQTKHRSLQEALLTMANNGGKYLRPSLLILSTKATEGKITDKIIKLASAIEILHMATLIHDDIIDDSNKRRGAISIQAQFGKDTAVYAGDLLFTNFFDLMLQTTNEHEYLVENATTMRAILNGELGQMNERFNNKQKIDDYINNVKGKTAALFKLATKEGAYFGGQNQFAQIMANFGENLGVAFQIIDDILDYTGSQKMNKPVLEDLTTGVYSLPLLFALQDEDLHQELTSILNKKYQMTKIDIEHIQRIILNSNAINQSRSLAQSYSLAAIDNLTQLPQNSATKLLTKMTKEMLSRKM
ncbi:polyprenyl synthetase family protein [Lactobacillus sp. LL6]|uniref:polyprenyl synthetase family protein n=1 Tax=Lactobacillus sp. LL6 TaxID=2596827 RepID=UPI001186B6EF|nr:polyprenyl synthetase family protein [Lactobacillus sp. LL6]TSO26865.1 polyprenyl synthetase family protein [Lactobacillus sp. LL6]